ncbi:competence protein CoiA family protein [Bacillus sp. FJAT-47783]|uniref:competence protein CoiA n=1 Tax=Bacillus sp. FJAT-47783 TaxID=2922712 RepID=UPI001FAD07E1|nr:competence protein CoiA family protein [Bacillus sp. FJAT-47783]
MLVAETSDQEKIYLLDSNWTKDRLKQLKNNVQFRCPACQNPVQLKMGDTRIPHFAHLKSVSCSVDSENETLYHMEGKMQLFRWLKNQGISCELETYFPSIKQRADLFLSSQTEKYAIEYQCSKIPYSLMKSRTEGYENESMIPIWILGGNRLKRVKTFEFRFNEFLWLFIRFTSKGKPFMIFYCSKLKHFMILETIVPFSKQTVFANIKLFHPFDISFQDCLNPKQVEWNISTYQKQWFLKLQRYRQTPKVHLNKQEKVLQSMLYETYGIPLTHIPSEAFIPLPNGWKIDEAVYVWQAVILYAISTIPLKETFHLQRVLWLIKRHFGSLSVRVNRFHSPFLVQEVVQSYLDRLVKLETVEKIGRDSYQRVKEQLFTNNLEEILSRDRALEVVFRLKRKV